MAFPVAAGTQSYSGIYIPEIWSAKVLVKFYEYTVLAAISNTEYEGEIKDKGDKVIIRTLPDMVINTYIAGQNLSYDQPVPTTVELLIDKGKYQVRYPYQVIDNGKASELLEAYDIAA